MNITSKSLTTPRVPIKKLTQLNEKEKAHFIELFSSHNFTVTEKVDGFAFRLIIDNGQMYFESAYSGVTTYEHFIFPSIAKEIFNTSTIKHLFNYPIKISGELIWNLGIDYKKYIDKNIEVIAPVCTSYIKGLSRSGSYFVIFDMYKIEEDKLIKLSDYEYSKLFALIKLTCTKEDSLDYIDGRSLTYDFSNIAKEKDFEYLYNMLLNKVDSLQSNLNNGYQLNSPIEGVVITFDNNEKFGIFSSNYKTIKNEYYTLFNLAKELIANFKYDVYGYKLNSAIKRHNTHLTDNADKLYKEKSNILINTLQNIADSICMHKIIPASCMFFQRTLLFNMIKKIKSCNAINYIE